MFVEDSQGAAQQGVHPTGGSRRVFGQFGWLEAGSGKVVFSRPAHQRVTPAVRRLSIADNKNCKLVREDVIVLLNNWALPALHS